MQGYPPTPAAGGSLANRGPEGFGLKKIATSGGCLREKCMEPYITPSFLLFILIQALVTLFAGYYFLISLAGFKYQKEDYREQPVKRFAVITAAHNEERVIGELLDSLFHLDYPRHLFDIFVVADNCTDHTAEVCRRFSGVTVMERRNETHKGKGYALEYAFNRIFGLDREYDAVVVFDADNLVSPNFLRVMNSRLLRGESIIQGYLDTKNPGDTWITRSIHVGYLLTNRFWQLGKYNLGLTCALGGTGMCLATGVLKTYGWGMTSLTEDLEFQTKALLNNIKVTWAHEAKVFDEKPLSLRLSWRQRQRWMQGHCNVATRYLGRLLSEGIRQKNLAMIDGALYLFQPIYIMITGVSMLLSLFNIQRTFADPGWLILLFVLQFGYFSLGLVLERVRPEVYLWFIYYPVFALTWIPVAFTGFLMRNHKVWKHTMHVRNIALSDLQTFTLPEDTGFFSAVDAKLPHK